MTEPLPLGLELPPYGKVSAVSCRGGERYYMLVSNDGRDVALMPGSDMERWAELIGARATGNSDAPR